MGFYEVLQLEADELIKLIQMTFHINGKNAFCLMLQMLMLLLMLLMLMLLLLVLLLLLLMLLLMM